MGQDFRWYEWDDGWHSGVLSGNLIHMQVEPNAAGVQVRLRLRPRLTCYIPTSVWTTLSKPNLCRHLPRRFGCQLVEKYHGLRLLRQDSWECTVAYICSPQGIPWIERNLEDIAHELGDPIELEGEVRPAFPTPDKVRKFGPRAFEKLNFRFPDVPRYIIAAAERICNGALDLAELTSLPYTEATWRLMEKYSASRKAANGIGNKVANCITLFALDKLDAFPVDVHIGRALTKWYDNCPMPENSQSLSDGQYREIVRWAHCRFGKNAGYAISSCFTSKGRGIIPFCSECAPKQDSGAPQNSTVIPAKAGIH